MSLLLDGVLDQAANGSPATVALSSESVAVLFFATHYLTERENWLDKAEDPLDEVTDTDWDAIEKLVGNAAYELMTPVIETFPESFYVDALAMEIGVGNSLNRVVNAGFLVCHTVGVTTPAIGNYLIARAFLKKGTYAVNALGQTNTSFGIMTIESGVGSVVTTADWYSAAPVANVVKAGSMSIDADGEVQIFCYMGSKNAASSNYGFALQAIWGHRTGD